MSWTNAVVPNRYGQWREEERAVALAAELALWKQRAEALAAELRNIPEALREYGEWEIREADGRVTRVIPAPPAVAREEER